MLSRKASLKIIIINIILIFSIYPKSYDNKYNDKRKLNRRYKYKNIGKTQNMENNLYQQDNLTIVSAYYIMKSKHSFEEYLQRISSFAKLNHSLVFFTEKKFINTIKELRPKNLHNKTVFIEIEMKDFYSNRKFGKEFEETFKLDWENYFQSVPLYLVWAEKCFFLMNAILKNYFNSTCFYWVDAGLFMKKEQFSNKTNWPSTQKCFEDPRVIINSLRNVSDLEIEKLKNFSLTYYYNEFLHRTNVGAAVFGGQIEYTLKFIELYERTLISFINHEFFIGKEQNLYAFIAYLHPEIVKLVYSRDWYYFIKYLS